MDDQDQIVIPSGWRMRVPFEDMEWALEPISGIIGKVVETYDKHGDPINESGGQAHKLMLRPVSIPKGYSTQNDLYTLYVQECVFVVPNGVVPPSGVPAEKMTLEDLQTAAEFIVRFGGKTAIMQATEALAHRDQDEMLTAVKTAEADLTRQIDSFTDDLNSLSEFRKTYFGDR